MKNNEIVDPGEGTSRGPGTSALAFPLILPDSDSDDQEMHISSNVLDVDDEENKSSDEDKMHNIQSLQDKENR